MRQVFISYRHESEAHSTRVRVLAQTLRDRGLVVSFDEFFLADQPEGPNEKWSRWSINQAKQSACVLIVGSAGWYGAFSNPQAAAPGEGVGAAAEASVIQEQLYQDKWVTNRHRVVILDPVDLEGLPIEISGWRHFAPLTEAQDLDDLTRWAERLMKGDSPASGSREPKRPPAAPTNLHYLCDRSDQESALGLFLSKATQDSFRRPILVIVHGDSKEAHAAFVERMRGHFLPVRLKQLGLSGGIQVARLLTRLTSLNDIDLSSEVRRKVAEEGLQMEVTGGSDQELIDCFKSTRARLIAPVFDLSSREAFAGEKSYVEMLVNYWSQFPDLPPVLAVIAFICIKYVEPEPASFFSRMLSFKKTDSLERLRELMIKLGTDLHAEGKVKVIHKVLPELKPVEPEDVERWFLAPSVASHVRRQMGFDAIRRDIFKEQTAMPMEHVLDALEKFIHH